MQSKGGALAKGNFVFLVCYLCFWCAFPKSILFFHTFPLLVLLPHTKWRHSQLSKTHHQAHQCLRASQQVWPISQTYDIISTLLSNLHYHLTSISFWQAFRPRRPHSDCLWVIILTLSEHHLQRQHATCKPLVRLNITCILQVAITYCNSMISHR